MCREYEVRRVNGLAVKPEVRRVLGLGMLFSEEYHRTVVPHVEAIEYPPRR